MTAHPPKTDAEDWAALLRALGEEVRLRIIAALLEGPLCVSEITERVGARIYNTSRHLQTLRRAGLVQSRRSGPRVIVDLTPKLRRRLGGGHVLDLGCCQFDFDALRRRRPKSP